MIAIRKGKLEIIVYTIIADFTFSEQIIIIIKMENCHSKTYCFTI